MNNPEPTPPESGETVVVTFVHNLRKDAIIDPAGPTMPVIILDATVEDPRFSVVSLKYELYHSPIAFRLYKEDAVR